MFICHAIFIHKSVQFIYNHTKEKAQYRREYPE